MFDFENQLKALRKSKGITQKQLASAIGASERGIQQYELGERKPTYDMLIALANYFDVPLDYLTGRGIFAEWDKVIENKEKILSALSKSLSSQNLPLINPEFIQKIVEDEDLLMRVMYAAVDSIEFNGREIIIVLKGFPNDSKQH